MQHSDLGEALAARFSDAPAPPQALGTDAALARLATRGSCRSFADRAVDPGLIDTLCALALCAPTKSDLQQRDIVIIDDPALLGTVKERLADQPWTQGAPLMLAFCANNRRQRQVHAWRDRPFANDHLDAFFNASVDAGIALSAFVIAAEAAGLGTCPISAFRNQPGAISDLLGLPEHVFVAAGLAVGYPAAPPPLSPRLPLSVTVHRNRFDETGLEAAVAGYDAHRAAVQPYAQQRGVDAFGTADPYTWSEDKARQYSRPERADFGAFVRAKGFCLD